jgi:hypothetical protein
MAALHWRPRFRWLVTYLHTYLIITYPPVYLHINISKHMQNCTSREANTFLASQEIPDLLWTLKAHLYLHNSTSTVRILNKIDPFHKLGPTSLKTIAIIYPHLRLGLVVPFLQVFPQKTLYKFLFSLDLDGWIKLQWFLHKESGNFWCRLY